jgi:hypothetical protein
MMINLGKALGPWVLCKDKAYRGLLHKNKTEYLMLKAFDKKLGACWTYFLFGENRSYRRLEDAMFEFDKVLINEGYTLLTTEQYEKYLLLI